MSDDLRPDTMRSLPALPDGAKVSVVMPARGEPDRLTLALEAVLGQQPPVDEVVVAAACEQTAEAARDIAVTDERVRVVDNPDGGTSAGLNTAIAAAGGDVLVRVDTHALIPDGYVATALRTLRSTGAANVGGRQVPTAQEGFAEAVAVAMRSKLGSGGATYRSGTRAGPADTVYLGVFRRDALEVVGGFDEAFVRNQDAELNDRLRAHGFIVWFEPALEVTYRPRDTVGSLAAQYFDYGRWRRATARRHHTLKARQVAAPALVVALALLAVASVALRSVWPIVIGLGAYAVWMVLVGIFAARRLLIGLRATAALITMHLSWGVGFLIGPPRLTSPPEPSRRG